MPYDITKVVDAGTAVLNVTSYEAYSPLYLPITYAAVYGIGFALATSVLVHTALHHGPAIVQNMRRVKTEEDDIHFKLMKAYPDVPDWWYLGFLLACSALSVIAVTVCYILYRLFFACRVYLLLLFFLIGL